MKKRKRKKNSRKKRRSKKKTQTNIRKQEVRTLPSSVKSPNSTIILSVKRFFAFLIDLLVGCSLILLIEAPIGLFLGYFTNYNLSHPSSPFLGMLSDLHLILIPVFLGIVTSSYFGGISPGMRLMGIKLISTELPWLSFTGCTARAFLILAPAYLYVTLFFGDYYKLLPIGTTIVSSIEFVILLFLLLVFPLSIISGKGKMGFHDLLLQTIVINNKKKENIIFQYSFQRIAVTFISISLISFLSQQILISIPSVRKIFSNFSISAGKRQKKDTLRH